MGHSHIDKHARTLFRFLILVLMSTNLFSLFHTHISIFKTSLNSYPPPFSTSWHHNARPAPSLLSHTLIKYIRETQFIIMQLPLGNPGGWVGEF